MGKIEPLVWDGNRFKMYTEDVMRELFDKTNEIIEKVNEKSETVKKEGRRKGDEKI